MSKAQGQGTIQYLVLYCVVLTCQVKSPLHLKATAYSTELIDLVTSLPVIFLGNDNPCLVVSECKENNFASGSSLFISRLASYSLTSTGTVTVSAQDKLYVNAHVTKVQPTHRTHATPTNNTNL